MYRAADFSPCGQYRYRLVRDWSDSAEAVPVTFIMLNPSTANAEHDDATIRKCMKFARTWGYNRLEVVNLFAWRSTDPHVLPEVADPIGPDNGKWLASAMGAGDIVVCAWGAHGKVRGIGDVVLRWVKQRHPYKVHALKRNKDGSPQHPLYIRDDVLPVPI